MSGRPASLVGAVEAGGTKFVLAVADERGAILTHARIPTGRPEETLPPMMRFFRAAAQEHGPIAAFGVGTFGPISLDRRAPDWGRFTTTPKPGWGGASLPEALAEFGVPVALDTDVNAAALGEWLTGAGQGAETLAYTTVGTGIGVGVLRGGEPLGGITHYEGGHVRPRRVDGDDFPGVCARHRDCVEGLASGPAIQARWGASLDRLGEFEVDLTARYLAEFATSLVLLHMPERLIFGGGVCKTPGLIPALRRHTERLLEGYVVHPAFDPGLERYIVTPTLGDDAGIRGAIELGRRMLR
ncbi:ROK family protein [Altererythrobacter sp. TH136]|uniref:ROK family protein n=1 Tax=Altererythrobacter sp. TH136 TaxID=2067415 RepID=UPI00116424D6|nr:ROK family protein [Altererythrobacter sp. TH136]QDM41386.1 ROK family protein [Altererythrobacter sp. TH136]